jgi:hypothetical protein
LAKAPPHQPTNGRTLFVRVTSGIIVLIVGAAMAFFFNHTQLDAHSGMENRSRQIELRIAEIKEDIGSVRAMQMKDLDALKADVKANRESLIRIETKLQTSPPKPHGDFR